MLLRATLGLALLIAFLLLGSWLVGQRSEGRAPWRNLAGTVDRAAGFLALAFLALLVVAALRLAL